MDIDGELASFLVPGPFSVIAASCDSNLIPETVRAWGLALLEDGRTISFCVGRQPSQRFRQNLRAGDRIALSIANVTTYQAIQLKGLCTEIGEPDADERARVLAHGEAFVAGLQMVGISAEAGRGTLVSDVVRLRFIPDALFDQTPGPEAGSAR